MRFRLVGTAIVIILVAVVIVAVIPRYESRRSQRTPVTPPSAEFIGATRCGACHATEYAAWKTSQHAVAMQVAAPGAVLGRFDSTRFSDAGATSVFFRRGTRYFAQAQGPDGAQHDYEIRYTFGVFPLQQYLVELGGGHIQALTVAWDTRSAAQGGQRWFSLTPGQRIPPTDQAHWSSRQSNWNYMCADCHSTAVRKGYDAPTDQFHTTWTEVNVACEACHGPGSRHATWAAYPGWIRRALWTDDGLPAQLTERRAVRWSSDPATATPLRNVPRTTDHEIQTCAQCHARRTHIADGYTAGAPLLDFYIPFLLTAGLYHPDGQQRDEVYNYASFLQSRMYASGVTCADCHDPHTGHLRRPGNAVCEQCHRADKYDTRAHHFHSPAGDGGQCVSCHMPDTTYMQIDPRRDHSLRVPRPDLSVALGTPNACNRCHQNRDAAWAAAAVRTWYGRVPVGFQRFATAFAADDRHLAGAADSLGAVANDPSEPVIVRASALARLAEYPGPVALRAAQAWTRDTSALVRLSALQILEAFPPPQRVAIAAPLLGDPFRSVRQGVAWVLAQVADSLTASQRLLFIAASQEFIASQQYNADRVGNRLSLGLFYWQLGQIDAAATEYRAALRIDPRSAQAQALLRALPSPVR